MWNGNFKAAISSLRTNKWRSSLTMLGIVLGVCSVTTILSLGEGLKQQVTGEINSQGNNVLTVRSGKLVTSSSSADQLNLLAFFSASTLTTKDYESISALPSVESAAPINFVTNAASGERGEFSNLYVVGTSPALPKISPQKIEYGNFFSPEDIGDKVAVIGADVAEQLYGRLNPLGATVTIGGEEFTVRGVLSPSKGGLLSLAEIDYNSAIFIPMPAALTLTGGQTNILQILAYSKQSNTTKAVNEITKTLTKLHGTQNFSVLEQHQLQELAGSIIDTVTRFISGIAAIALLVGGIGIMDIMLVSVSERIREIGIRKALGATNRQILTQFLTEGITLTIGGGAVGVGLAYLIYTGLRVYTHIQPVITLHVILLSLGVCLVVGIIFSTAPALKAARKNPIDALRGE